ncbi:hypothetical protein L195_g040515, partial [Trifolium pratense]
RTQATKLLGYDFEIVYKQGKLNRGADVLSRVSDGGVLSSMVYYSKWDQEQQWREEVERDEKLQKINSEVQQDPNARPGYVYKQGILLYEGRQKYLATSPGGLLQPLPIPDRVWEDVSIDFITGLPKSKCKGYEAILVVVDRLSKYSHFIPLKHPYTARIIAEVFREILSSCLETYLRCFISDQPKTWVAWVHWAEYWFNTTFHSSTEKTPFEIIYYGRGPPVMTRWLQGEVRVEAVQRDLLDRDEALRQLKDQLVKAQERMKNQADRKRTEYR